MSYFSISLRKVVLMFLLSLPGYYVTQRVITSIPIMTTGCLDGSPYDESAGCVIGISWHWSNLFLNVAIWLVAGYVVACVLDALGPKKDKGDNQSIGL